jgi:hypothetical protein
MFKRVVALTCTVMVCAAMFLSVSGCSDKKPAPATTPPAGDPKPAEGGGETPKP